MTDRYILDDVTKEAIPEPNMNKWGKWIGSSDNKRILLDENDELIVSTVFLGIDHSFGGGRPILFETMVFRQGEGWSELDCDRYRTWSDAIDGHMAMCNKWLGEDSPHKDRR